MEQLLSFLSDLILFTFGLVVVVLWIVVFAVIAIEVWDHLFENEPEPIDEDEES